MISGPDWLAATTKSLTEVAETYFDVESMESEALSDENSAQCGAIIGLASDDNTVQLMVLSTRRGAEILGKALLGFEPGEEIDTGDLADAIGEIVNIVAGMVKTAVNDQDDKLNLTLPTFIEGTLAPIGGQIVTSEVITLGSVATKVVAISGCRKVSRQPRSSAA